MIKPIQIVRQTLTFGLVILQYVGIPGVYFYGNFLYTNESYHMATNKLLIKS